MDKLDYLKPILEKICEDIHKFERGGCSDGGLEATITNSLLYVENEARKLRRKIAATNGIYF